MARKRMELYLWTADLSDSTNNIIRNVLKPIILSAPLKNMI